MASAEPPSPLFLLFPFAFAGFWCGIMLFLSWMGGWRRLAEHFPRGDRKPSGRRYWMQSAKLGLANYNGCLIIHSAPEGLYLSVWLPFRPGHPPLFIPWEAMHHVETRRVLWSEWVGFSVGSPTVAKLSLSKKVFEGSPVVL